MMPWTETFETHLVGDVFTNFLGRNSLEILLNNMHRGRFKGMYSSDGGVCHSALPLGLFQWPVTSSTHLVTLLTEAVYFYNIFSYSTLLTMFIITHVSTCLWEESGNLEKPTTFSRALTDSFYSHTVHPWTTQEVKRACLHDRPTDAPLSPTGHVTW